MTALRRPRPNSTESQFADDHEPFFNSIGHGSTFVFLSGRWVSIRAVAMAGSPAKQAEVVGGHRMGATLPPAA
jgi:hypothetical protein